MIEDHGNWDIIDKELSDSYKPDKKNKLTLGEVFTPKHIINKMLDKLPPQVWHNPHLTWLDPCAGFGNFHIEVYKRLIKNIPHDTVIRQLYFVEINPQSIEKIKKFFGNHINIINLDIFKYQPPMKFDIVLGNPPYQKNKVHYGGSGVLYHKYTSKCLKLLKLCGYLLWIIPVGWKRPFINGVSKGFTGQVFNELKHYHFVELDLNYGSIGGKGISEPLKHFPSVDIILLKKTTEKEDTFIRNHWKGTNPTASIFISSTMFFLPCYITNHSLRVLNKILLPQENKLDLIKGQHRISWKEEKYSKTLTNEHIYKHWHFVTKEKVIYAYLKKKMKDTDVPKIIMTMQTTRKDGYFLDPQYIEEKLGVTCNSQYLIKWNNKERCLKFLNSDIVNFFIKITQYSTLMFRMMDNILLRELSEPDIDDFPKYFNLDAHDIALCKLI